MDKARMFYLDGFYKYGGHKTLLNGSITILSNGVQVGLINNLAKHGNVLQIGGYNL